MSKEQSSSEPSQAGSPHPILASAQRGPEAERAFLQSILDGVGEPIMVIGTDYRVMLMNRAAREFAGSEGEALAVQCYQVSHLRAKPCSGTDHPCPLEEVRRTGAPVTVVHQHFQAGAEARTVEVIASPLWGDDGAFQGIIESVRDITERRRSEESLQRYAQRLRALTARLAELSELERQRLARELHDQVGQNLTALGINLNIIRMQVAENSGAEPRLADSLDLVEQTAEKIRDLMADLRPPVLDDYGLLAALHWYGEQFTRRTGIDVLVQGEESLPRTSAHLENALFRIAQEALMNVAKHAQTAQAKVRVEVASDAVHMTVEDDGVGFDATVPPSAAGAHGWGLLTMNERALAVGGSCQVQSVPGEGTRIVVEVPL